MPPLAQLERKYLRNKHVFQIKSFKWEIVFATKTEQDYYEWMEAFKKLQTDTEKKKKTLMDKGILSQKVFEDFSKARSNNKD